MNTVAKLAGLCFNHHRALDDARALAACLFRIVTDLREQMNISNIGELNNSISGEHLKRRQSYDFACKKQRRP